MAYVLMFLISAFIRKVYGVLVCQLTVTMLIKTLFLFV